MEATSYGYEVVKNLDGRGEHIRGSRTINPVEAAVAERIFKMLVQDASWTCRLRGLRFARPCISMSTWWKVSRPGSSSRSWNRARSALARRRPHLAVPPLIRKPPGRK